AYASGTNIGINNANKSNQYSYSDTTKGTKMDYWKNGIHYQYTRTESYRKNNSNKGWKAYLRVDTTDDGKVDDNDTTYYSYDAYSVDGAYQYVTSLGHLRVWVPSQTQASLVFEADRSFSTQNYRYLYYSYSMRDVETGIAAEEPDTNRTDGKKPGIAVAIKSNQLGSSKSYSEIMTADGTRTWAFYDENNAYWTDTPSQDNRTFKTTINAALDLSTLKGIESVNQFVFYLNNPLGTRGDGDSAEYYINYLYLSNVPPTELISSQLEVEAVQYYYLMDNTGDRYSARFPTIDNPTGQVSGLNGDNDRVNPVIVKRGARLSEGTYFNGELLYGYGTTTDGKKLDEDTFSKGYYEKTYGCTDGFTGSMKNILFYAGESSDIQDINDYYQYKDRDGDGKGEIYDMLWSYGRWYMDNGTNMNTLYIGRETDATLGATKDGVSGYLVRRYATENYVLLRSGIEPKKYNTYYDADGGQMQYYGSADEIWTGVQKNENNYYITQSVVMSYFTWPLQVDKTIVEPVKFGFIFDGWYSTETDVDGDGSTMSEAGEPAFDGELLHVYNKKGDAKINFFVAKWSPDPAYKDKKFTATFRLDAQTTWVTRTADVDHEFMVDIPSSSQITAPDGVKRILGWRDASDPDAAIFLPGSKLTVTKDVVFEPVYAGSDEDDGSLTIDITVTGAKLYFVRADASGDLTEMKNLTDPSTQNITMTETGSTRTYYDVPRNIVCILIPDSATAGNLWHTPLANDDNETIFLNGVKGAILSANYKYYQFAAYSDVTVNYAAPVSGSAQAESLIVTAPTTLVKNRQMEFYSQVDLDAIEAAGGTFLAAGTLYTKKGVNFNKLEAAEGGLAANMTLKMSTVNEETIHNADYNDRSTYESTMSAARFVQATTTNKRGQYMFMVTENKGNEATYYARGYVLYKVGSEIKVAYSDIVACATVEANAYLAG
ncbi:MAG: hypothetical protein IKV35_04180, partial [Clostridia bacterium]|nr:hypothetical protein [Clostridia bacterium]